MAIEDAAVIGNLFSRIASKNQISHLLHAYQDIRYSRAVVTQLESQNNQTLFHLPDGPQQRARDASMRISMEYALKEARGELTLNDNVGNTNMWADRVKSDEQFSYDADEAVNRWWRQNGNLIVVSSKL